MRIQKLVPLLLIFLLLISLFTSLGLWQLRRAKEKEILLNQSRNEIHTLFSIQKLKSGNKNGEYRDVTLQGRYDAHHLFFLINQFHQHQLGQHVLNPFLLETGDVILVDRGWIPVSKSVPRISTQKMTIKGKLKLPRKNPFIFSSTEKNNSQLWLEYDLSLLRPYAKSVIPFVLLLDPQEANGFVRDWIVTTIPPERHYGYAVQWFALACLSLVIFLILLRQKNES